MPDENDKKSLSATKKEEFSEGKGGKSMSMAVPKKIDKDKEKKAGEK